MPCILIVEDFPDAREMYEMYLVHHGYRVLTAGDAPSGIEAAIAAQPDLIFMDAGLPGMSGWEAVQALKSDARVRDIPVFMLTGHVLADSRDLAHAAGADGFLAKPCLPDDLVQVIQQTLSAGADKLEHKRLQKRTAELKAEHAALSRDKAPFNQADHDRHTQKLKEHRKDLQRHRRKK